MPHGSEKCLCFTGSVTVCGSWLYSRMERGFGLGKEGSTQTWSLTSLKSTIPTIRLLSLKGLYLNLSIKWRWSVTYLGKFHSRVSESIPLAEERPVAQVPLGGMVTLRHTERDTGKWQPLLCEAQRCDTSSAWWVRHFAAYLIDKAIATREIQKKKPTSGQKVKFQSVLCESVLTS